MPYTPFAVVLKINANGQGFEERYVLKPGTETYAAALTIGQQIAWGRTAFFAEGIELLYARVSTLGPGADKRTCVLPYPLGPHPSWANGVGVGDALSTLNDPRTCIQMAAETALGKWGNRYIRCIPDTWVVANKLVPAVAPYTQEPAGLAALGDLSPAGNLSHLQVCQSFWSYLRDKTTLPQKISPSSYNSRDIAVFVYQQITSRKIGRRFRLSAGKASVK